MDKKNIAKTIKDCESLGHKIRLRDIAYCILKRSISDAKIVYNCIFGVCDDTNVITTYDKSDDIKFLAKYLKANYFTEKTRRTASTKDASQDDYEQSMDYDDIMDMSFESNKAELVKKLSIIKKWEKEGKLDPKDALTLEINVRKLLNEKFGASKKESSERIVVVPPKMNGICKKYNVECFFQTKEYAMKQWNLIEKPSETETN